MAETNSPAGLDKEEGGHGKTVAAHYNKLCKMKGLEDRKESRILYMRNFNNWIKTMLISDIMDRIRSKLSDKTDITVLDLGGGTGGDLLKWKRERIKTLVLTDIAEVSVEQAGIRYNDMKKTTQSDQLFTGEFITVDCSKESLKAKYKDPSITFDLTSCQFSYHYSFESKLQAETMLRNACECLKPGGYFIGTIPNSMELVKRLRESKDMTFGSEVYRVMFETADKENIPLFGARYDFHLDGVVDCPEFLIYFPLLQKMAEKYNMELVYRESFSEFYSQHIKSKEGRELIGNMQGLEMYPAEGGTELLSKVDDAYLTAQQHLDKCNSQQHQDKEHRLGTLSKPEWDAVSLYMVFAFRKKTD